MEDFDEVNVYAAFHLEAWTNESEADVFARACAALKAAGIRVKAGTARSDDRSDIGGILYR